MTAEAILSDAHAAYVRPVGDDLAEVDLLVPGMHCAGCMGKIERGFAGAPAVDSARVNLGNKRVHVRFRPSAATLEDLMGRLKGLGFDATPFSLELAGAHKDKTARELLQALAVAGFASANIMLFSVPVWFGYDMQAETITLFHWISAIIATGAITYAGRPFFRSALAALRTGAVNMDVPISLAVLLSLFSSMYESSIGSEHVYFDAGVMLLFFLLIGRYLDQMMRAKAGEAAQNLLALQAVAATVVDDDGAHHVMPADQVKPGSVVLVATGMRVPVDGEVINGDSEIDSSLVTGETLPQAVGEGSRVFAGTLNITAPVRVRTTSGGDKTLLAEIVHLMEAAEQGRGQFVRIADRLARAYAPMVHALAALTFVGWWWAAGDAHLGLIRAIAVLIITCPCALGLAVPVVQVVASGRLLKQGIFVKSGDALERMAKVDTMVFDKTGTLTLGRLTLENRMDIAAGHLALAAAMGRQSSHPLAQAVAGSLPCAGLPQFDRIEEQPGAGLIGFMDGAEYRLGKRDFAGACDAAPASGPELWLRPHDGEPVQFVFTDAIRTDAAETIDRLSAMGIELHLLSGDRGEVVQVVADDLGLASWQGGCQPQDKIAFIERLKAEGRTVAMIGDGLNDAPSLRAAAVSMSPASATDVTQTAADFVFQGEQLAPVAETLHVSRRTQRLVLENFGLALGYNVIAVPLAVLGYVTPLVAALAMSASSLVVTMNALRIRGRG